MVRFFVVLLLRCVLATIVAFRRLAGNAPVPKGVRHRAGVAGGNCMDMGTGVGAIQRPGPRNHASCGGPSTMPTDLK